MLNRREEWAEDIGDKDKNESQGQRVNDWEQIRTGGKSKQAGLSVETAFEGFINEQKNYSQ